MDHAKFMGIEMKKRNKLNETCRKPTPQGIDDMRNLLGAVNNVQHAIDQIRPRLHEEGYDIEFVGLENLTVKIHLKRAETSTTALSLVSNVESLVKKIVPKIKGVEVVS